MHVAGILMHACSSATAAPDSRTPANCRAEGERLVLVVGRDPAVKGERPLLGASHAPAPTRKTPFRLTRMTASKSSSLISRKSAARTMPALQTATSSDPNWDTAAATAASTWRARGGRCGAGRLELSGSKRAWPFAPEPHRLRGASSVEVRVPWQSTMCEPLQQGTTRTWALSPTSHTAVPAAMPSPRSSCSALASPAASTSASSTLAPARPSAWAQA